MRTARSGHVHTRTHVWRGVCAEQEHAGGTGAASDAAPEGSSHAEQEAGTPGKKRKAARGEEAAHIHEAAPAATSGQAPTSETQNPNATDAASEVTAH